MTTEFNFEWFLNAYNKIHDICASPIDDDTMKYIEKQQSLYLTDYKMFIRKCMERIGDDETEYLKKEKFCLLCKQNYPAVNDPFVCIISKSKGEDITYELCDPCINKHCDAHTEPWDIIWIDLPYNTVTLGAFIIVAIYKASTVFACSIKSIRNHTISAPYILRHARKNIAIPRIVAIFP